MLILNVPFNEKEEAKKLGAKWNPAIKKWYVQDRAAYPRFSKWIAQQGDIVACEYIYVIEGRKVCFRCKQETRVISFGLERFYDLYDYCEGEEITYQENGIYIVGPIDPIPPSILSYLQGKYNYKKRYSNTTHESHICNCCDNCDVLQGDFFLYSEVDSPFFIDSIEKIKELKIYKIPLEQDIIIRADLSYTGYEKLIKEIGHIETITIMY